MDKIHVTMPELPEVECVRRSLLPGLIGRRVVAVRINRKGVIHGSRTDQALLLGRRIDAIERRGKQLAIIGGAANDLDTPVLCVHLGMTGSLTLESPESKHVHVVWTLDDGGTLTFRDPRRFGGLWPFANMSTLIAMRWSALGPDALQITPTALHQRLTSSSRPIKAVLLDQEVLAGLGNIYVCELLHACKLHPLTPSDQVNLTTVQALVPAMRQLLQRAVRGGGSTLRDYLDANGKPGRYQDRHQVYGRDGQACRRCGQIIAMLRLQGRSTQYCPECQRPVALASSSKRDRY